MFWVFLTFCAFASFLILRITGIEDAELHRRSLERLDEEERAMRRRHAEEERRLRRYRAYVLRHISRRRHAR